ncbi:MAG: type II toxin-antitoxin system Phd/YefM family antitoxin [Actinomycetales bacterium]|nr:type II toxin-antitoxin system Phd/YefM family antitoxin [Actinomycetales bacterium]
MQIYVSEDEAQRRFPALLDAVISRDEVVITRDGEAVAILQAVTHPAEQAQSAIDALRAIGARAKPGPESIRELIDEGRRWI